MTNVTLERVGDLLLFVFSTFPHIYFFVCFISLWQGICAFINLILVEIMFKYFVKMPGVTQVYYI